MGLSPLDLLNLTYKSLRGNWLRSTLTGLGVFMGVAAVSATLQVGSISREIITRQLNAREAPQLGIYLHWRSKQRLKWEDLEFLRQRLAGWEAISTSMRMYSEDPVIFQNQSATPERRAVSDDFLFTSGRTIVAGNFFSTADFDEYRPVTIIDQNLAAQLFPEQTYQEAIGQRIYTEGRIYTIVGVFESRQIGAWDEGKGLMLVPISFYQALTGQRHIRSISVRPRKLEDMEQLTERTIQLFEQRYPGEKFNSWTNVTDIVEQKNTLETTSQALLAVGLIALLVGGVGIANITIAAVIERTPEIGLRKAIGAKARDVMLQFVLEAALLSLLAGGAAIATVHLVTVTVAQKFDLPYKFERQTAVLALGSALLVGVGASFFPAMRASRLDPVKALRAK